MRNGAIEASVGRVHDPPARRGVTGCRLVYGFALPEAFINGDGQRHVQCRAQDAHLVVWRGCERRKHE
jgi:hypothetical protein